LKWYLIALFAGKGFIVVKDISNKISPFLSYSPTVTDGSTLKLVTTKGSGSILISNLATYYTAPPFYAFALMYHVSS